MDTLEPSLMIHHFDILLNKCRSKHLKGHLGPRVSHIRFLVQRDIPGSLSVTFLDQYHLRAERRRRKARRARTEKSTNKNCTLPTIHLGEGFKKPRYGKIR